MVKTQGKRRSTVADRKTKQGKKKRGGRTPASNSSRRSGANTTTTPARTRTTTPATGVRGSRRLGNADFERFIADNSELPIETARELWTKLRALMRDTLLSGRAVNLQHILTATPYVKPAFSYFHPQTGKQKTARARLNVKIALATSLKTECKSSVA